jgi:glycosyltransferase involved in cell wall biosynthesis
VEGVDVPYAPFVMSIGPPSRKKGTDILLRAFKGAPAAAGLLVWITSDRRSLLRYEGAQDLERNGALRVFESLGDQALGELCRRANALVVPSRWEGFSFPIAEALAVGTGVIASDIAAHREHAHTGGRVTLVRAEDDRELADAMLAAFDSPMRGPPVFETTCSAFAEAHARVYRSVVA